jgi:hypothetical protein
MREAILDVVKAKIWIECAHQCHCTACDVEVSGRRMAGIARNGTSEQARVAAAQALLDRGWGKAVQPHVGDGSNGSITVIIRQIDHITEKAEPVLIEHDDG